jgi:lipopolysaccharide export LptBFGC system permease protein LptF
MGGRRGAMASVGASFGIAIAYRAFDELFVQIGNLNQLPAPVAAWSPDAIFLLAGLYMMTRMRS